MHLSFPCRGETRALATGEAIYFIVVDLGLLVNDKNVILRTTLSVHHHQFLSEYHLKYPVLHLLPVLLLVQVPVVHKVMSPKDSLTLVCLLSVDFLRL